MRGDPQTRSQFMGVYPADFFIKSIPFYPAAIIINTEGHDHPGRHWVAIYLSENGHCDFFDSYGHPPQYYHEAWLHWIKYYSTSWRYNRLCVQPSYSMACGLHCLFFLYHRCHGMNLRQIQRLYTKDNLPLNDQIAEEDMESHLLEDIVIDDDKFIVNQLCSSLDCNISI
jgi:hypothetical protein